MLKAQTMRLKKIAKDFVARFLPKKMGLSKWQQIESFIRDHCEAELTRSIGPKCVKKFYPELFQEKKQHAQPRRLQF
jgi:hypothetical protein